ncbi:hypothetical protein NQ315_007093, partial [Exocentrus adspersus]
IGIIGGSGLDDPDILKNRREKRACNSFGDPSDVLILGEIDDIPCVLLARHGRSHNITPGNVNYRANIWALKSEGCTHIIASTATGSLQEHIKPGDIVILDQFIDRTTCRKQTFYDGQCSHPIGICHLPMEPAFCKYTRQIIIDAAEEIKLDVHKTGTVVAIEGPRYSNKAESNMFRLWGGHVINMTSVPEVVLAKEAGICYAAIALVTDYDCWRDTGTPVCLDDVLRTFKENVTKVTTLIKAVVPKIASQNWDERIKELRIGIIGGSGFDDPDIIKNRKEKKVSTPFGDPSDVLILGEISNIQCVLLARHGRSHTIAPGNVNYRANIWALKEEGCTHILASTATGSLQENIKPGDIVIIDSFIDRTQGRKQSFYDGEPGHPVGICHIPLEPAYCETTRQTVISVAEELNIHVHKRGTVVSIEGPRFSSRAESNMYRLWGGDIITMTAVPEVVLAKEAGICYTAIALVTDYDCWRDTGEKVCVAEVMRTFKENITKIATLIRATVPKIASKNWDQTIKELKAVVDGSVMLPH